MKKTLVFLTAIAVSFAAFAQDNTPEMLKKKELFSKTELFENTAIFSNPQANANLINEYEANPAAFKDDQLLPIVSCYLSFKNIDKAKSLIQTFSKAVPSNVRAIRMDATLSLISGEADRAIELYKKALSLGDKPSVKFLASAYLMNQKADEIAPYISDIKELAKGDMEALNICLLYALRNQKAHDDALLKEVLEAANYEAVMNTANPDGLATILRVYIAKRDVWPDKALLFPGRAAIAAEAWALANQIFQKVLVSQPDSLIGIKGMGVVQFRTGDIFGAAKSMKRALDMGDKEAASDGLLLYVSSNDKKIFNMFKDAAEKAMIVPQVRAAIVQKAVNDGDNAELFYMGCLGEGSDLLYKDAGVRGLINEGLKKYGDNSNASKVKTLLDSNAPADSASNAPVNPATAK